MGTRVDAVTIYLESVTFPLLYFLFYEFTLVSMPSEAPPHHMRSPFAEKVAFAFTFALFFLLFSFHLFSLCDSLGTFIYFILSTHSEALSPSFSINPTAAHHVTETEILG